jgi:3-isopropylmalate dehydratase small subunit
MSATATTIRGRARLLGEGINTDVHCSTKYMPGKDTAYAATKAFDELVPGFAGKFQPGDVIVAGRNFGINSSREQATHVLKIMGCAAVVAQSFGRQFFRNCINNGLPAVECTLEGVADGDEIEVDLASGKVRTARGERDVPALPREVQAILAAGGLHAFLKAHPNWEV